MKGYLKIYAKIKLVVVGIYLLIWLFTMFANWDVYTPWHWVYDLPTMDTVDRALIIILFVIIELSIVVLTTITKGEK